MTNNKEQLEFLNAYRILNTSDLSWDVTVYEINSLAKQEKDHTQRSNIKKIIWSLRKEYNFQCLGYGYVIDIDYNKVVIPQNWKIPELKDFNGYQIKISDKKSIQASNPQDYKAICGIIRESIKKVFKNNFSESIGSLWQDYNDFCQLPDFSIKEKDIV